MFTIQLKKPGLLIFGILLLLVVSAAIYIFGANRKHKGDLSLARVSVGNVCKIVEAEGETASENEVLLLSPASAIVQRIIRAPGSRIEEGEVILTLDESETRNELEAATDQLELLKNNLHKLQLSAKTIRIDLEHDIEVKKLLIASLKAELEDQKALLDVGGISQVKIDKTQQELVLAQKELQRASEKHTIRLRQLEADQKDIELQISMKQKQVDAKRTQLERMIVRSPVTGIVLEIRARTGEIKNKNELLVRISEHTRLKVRGEISEKQGELIRNGGKVYVTLDSMRLPGVIGNINPVLEDNKIQFDVFLETPQNEKLKVNQKVKLLIVEEEKQQVHRVPKGDYFKSSRNQCNVMVNSDVYTKDIETGLVGYEYIEIRQGLDSGDLVINSNFVRSRKIRSALAEESE